jgi:RimJ/RimL family protein N-acetyltransferase
MNTAPLFETERLLLRGWREADREPFARMNADPRVMEFFPARLSRLESDAMLAKIEAHFEQYGFGLCAAELRSSRFPSPCWQYLCRLHRIECAGVSGFVHSLRGSHGRGELWRNLE